MFSFRASVWRSPISFIVDVQMSLKLPGSDIAFAIFSLSSCRCSFLRCRKMRILSAAAIIVQAPRFKFICEKCLTASYPSRVPSLKKSLCDSLSVKDMGLFILAIQLNSNTSRAALIWE